MNLGTNSVAIQANHWDLCLGFPLVFAFSSLAACLAKSRLPQAQTVDADMVERP